MDEPQSGNMLTDPSLVRHRNCRCSGGAMLYDNEQQSNNDLVMEIYIR